MVVTLAFCNRDIEIVLPLFNWMAELGDYKPRHTLLLVPDPRCPQNAVQPILDAARPLFADVRNVPAKAQIDGWPQGANYMFRYAATYLADVRGLKYFLWLEPDAIPLKKGWLDQLEDEYLKAGKPFMGDDVNVADIPRHMSGVGVYPNPMVNFAGETMRSHDTAWDMSGKDQILPQAHFTKLIEHAWKHPTFTDPAELTTQIRPEAVLFHASKDGSLIRLLGEQQRSVSTRGALTGLEGGVHCSPPPGVVAGQPNEGVNPSPLPPQLPGSFQHHDEMYAHSVRGSGPVDAWTNFKSHDKPKEPIYDIFIRTYPVDYPWLQFCLRSIQQYATGFRKIWIVSPEKPVGDWPATTINGEWKVMNEESEDGYLSQQIHKLYADTITNYEADYILHIDSDTLFTRPVTPQNFFTLEDGIATDGRLLIHQIEKLIWYYTPYEHTQTPWKVITQKFLGEDPTFEFMRRLPMMIPSWLYPELRTFCFEKHKMNLGQYVKAQPYREFSEFNALGAYAWFKHHDKFHWVNTMEGEMPPPFARQFFSWGGLTEDVKVEIQNILSGGSNVPEAITNDNPVSQGSSSPLPAQTSNGDEETPGDHVRWLARYIEGSPSRRQYVMTQLKKARLVPLRRGKAKA